MHLYHKCEPGDKNRRESHAEKSVKLSLFVRLRLAVIFYSPQNLRSKYHALQANITAKQYHAPQVNITAKQYYGCAAFFGHGGKAGDRPPGR